MVHLPEHSTRLVSMNPADQPETADKVFMHIDAAVSELEEQGYDLDFILDVMDEYIEISDDLVITKAVGTTI